VTRYFADLGACFVALRFSQVTEFDSAPLATGERPFWNQGAAFVKAEMCYPIRSGHSLDASLSKMLGANEIDARDTRR
jgi:hypothetical protein